MGVVEEAGSLMRQPENPGFQESGPLRQLTPELIPPTPQGAVIR